jgi:hypothetical protein
MSVVLNSRWMLKFPKLRCIRLFLPFFRELKAHDQGQQITTKGKCGRVTRSFLDRLDRGVETPIKSTEPVRIFAAGLSEMQRNQEALGSQRRFLGMRNSQN